MLAGLGRRNAAKPSEHAVLFVVARFDTLLGLLGDVVQGESFALGLNDAAQLHLSIHRQPSANDHWGNFADVCVLTLLCRQLKSQGAKSFRVFNLWFWWFDCSSIADHVQG